MITENQLKINGVSIVASMLQTVSEVIVSVRGKPKYVIIPVEEYEEMKETELELALNESKKERANGDFIIVTAKQHIDSLAKELGIKQ